MQKLVTTSECHLEDVVRKHDEQICAVWAGGSSGRWIEGQRAQKVQL